MQHSTLLDCIELIVLSLFTVSTVESWINSVQLQTFTKIPSKCFLSNDEQAFDNDKEVKSEDTYSLSSNIITKRRLVQRPIRRMNTTNTLSILQQKRVDEKRKAKERHQEAMKDTTLFSTTSFDTIIDLSSSLKRSIIEILHLQQMTEIQEKTWPIAIQGKSILGRARTGTGKVIIVLL
jgi:hypothetical protein